MSSIERIVYFNGEYIPESQANINIRTHAFLYGTSVFEGIRAYYNSTLDKLVLFRAPEHYERLMNSMKILRMSNEYNIQDYMRITKETLRHNNDKQNIYIRPIVYLKDLAIGPSLNKRQNDFCLFTIPLGDYLDTQQTIAVSTSSWRRIDDNAIPARAKVSGSYVNTALAKAQAELDGYAETILLDDSGHVCEGSAMNIFLIRNGQLITSGITNNILEGITRDCIIKIAKNLGLDVIERQIDRTELYIADEAFFCGTGAQISAINSIDHYILGDGKIGNITQTIQDKYFDIVQGNQPKYADWYEIV